MGKWLDLSAYDMKLYLALMSSKKNVALLDKVPDEHVAAVTKLGFRKRKTGDAWITESATLNTGAFMRAFPKLVVREHSVDEYVIKIEAPSPDNTEKKSQSLISDVDVSTDKVLGYNRQGQKVIEKNGVRYFIDARGRQIQENGLVSGSDGLFLKATDDDSFAMCAEAFIESAARASEIGNDFGLTSFMSTVGLPQSRKFEFVEEINAAVVRFVSRKSIKSLHDRFTVAVNISRALKKYDIIEGASLDQLVLGRRLLGSDRDLLGNSIHLSGTKAEYFDSFKPKAVRVVDDAQDANFFLSFAKNEEDVLSAFENRKQGSMTVSFVPVSDRKNAEAILAKIAQSGAIEAASFASGISDQNDLVVTSLIGTPSAVPALVDVNNEAELWTWASVTVSERGKSMESLRTGLASTADFTSATMAQNSHQVPYKSASKTAEPITMVPKELDEATRSALNRLVSNFEDADKRVAFECGIPNEELSGRLSPEQIDGIGLAIHAEERGRAFLFADNTGVGKGRALMALVKRAAIQGRKVLVLSEKEVNLSDLMRDLKHIDGLKDIKPVVLNANATLIDEATGKPFEVGDRSILEQAIKDQTWPDEIPVIFGTYSQFNQDPEVSPRSAWLRNVVNEETLVVGDEIHVAASGTSNISENIAHAIEVSGPPVLSSATFAGDARAMPFFERLFPFGISGTEIAAMMRKGGEPFMEVVSSMLVTDGVMIRREKDMSKLEISQHIDDKRLDRNRQHMDSLAAVFGEMALLSGEMDRVMNSQNNAEGNILKGIQMKRMGFGSPLYTMTRLFTAALTAELAAERAVLALQNGEKPVILVENTIQGILKDAALAGGDSPDFKDVMRRVLGQLTKMSYANEDGSVDRVDVAEDNTGVQDMLIRINGLIDELPDLPASAIDVVKSKIRDAGFSCGEITGRVLEVVDGKVVNRRSRNITKTKNGFNSGEIDALVINSSGSTGIDLHASKRFKDQRRRVMIELQGPAYVLKQIQAYGRISRYDEVVPSRIEVLTSGLPVEIRLAAMRNQKLRRLSANVTSNRDSKFLTQNIPDLINPVGDQVVSKYAEMRPDLIQKLCLSNVNEKGKVKAPDTEDLAIDENALDNDRSANEFMARLALLSTEYQEKVLNELTAEYRLHIEELEARGENPLRPKELEGIVHIQENSLFEGKENSDLYTAFDGPMHIKDVSIERVAESIRSEKLMEAVEAGSELSGYVESAIKNLTESTEVYLEPYMPKDCRSVEEALAKNNTEILKIKKDIEVTAEALGILIPGREVTIVHGIDAEKTSAIVTSMHVPVPAYQHLRSQYVVELAIPGQTRISAVRLSTLLQDMKVAAFDNNGNAKFNVSDGLTGSNYDKILDKFEGASAKKTTPAKILSTNIFRAVRLATKYNLGQMVSYVDSDGNRHRGVLVKKNFEANLAKLPVRIDGVDQIVDALTDKNAKVTSSATNSKNAMIIVPLGRDGWRLDIPAPRNSRTGRKWPTEEFKTLFESGTIGADAHSYVKIDDLENLRDVLGVISRAGVNTFYVDAKYRSDFAEENERQVGALEMTA